MAVSLWTTFCLFNVIVFSNKQPKKKPWHSLCHLSVYTILSIRFTLHWDLSNDNKKKQRKWKWNNCWATSCWFLPERALWVALNVCQNQWEKMRNMRLHAANLMKRAPAVFLHGQSSLLQMNYSGRIRHFVTKHSSPQNCCRNIALTLICSNGLHSLQTSV